MSLRVDVLITARRWPGLFTHDRLHRVTPGNAERLTMAGVRFGVADCGAVCTPLAAHVEPDLPLCRRCFPGADPTFAQQS